MVEQNAFESCHPGAPQHLFGEYVCTFALIILRDCCMSVPVDVEGVCICVLLGLPVTSDRVGSDIAEADNTQAVSATQFAVLPVVSFVGMWHER